MAAYTIYITDDQGVRLGTIDKPRRVEYVKKIDDDAVGQMSVYLPTDYDISKLGLAAGLPDRRIEIWRSTEQSIAKRETVAFIRYLFVETTESGEINLIVSGPDQNELLQRRIVAYDKESPEDATTYSLKNGAADDMMKEIVAENLGSDAVDTDRDLSSWGLTVQADSTDGATITLNCEWLRVDDALRDIADASYENGTKVYYGIVPTSLTSFEFRTWTAQPGQDRTADPRIVFSMAAGNLLNGHFEFDHTKEINYIYAGGWGEGQERIITEVSNSTRIAASAINRREGFVNAQGETDGARTDEAYLALRKGYPVVNFRGEITDTPWTRYGQQWDVGDRVIVDFMGVQLPCLIAAVNVVVDESGAELITGRCEWQ